MYLIRIFATTALCVCLTANVAADDWVTPQIREVFSPDRQYFVRITPGESWGETWGFKGAKIGRHAQAAFFREQPDNGYRLERTIDMPNPVAPVEVFVSNNGNLITLDNWHNEGYGAVLVLYHWDGKIVRAYHLSDLFSRKEINSFPMSISSIWWHKGPMYINQDQQDFYMGYREAPDYGGLIFKLSTGSVRICATLPKYHCRGPYQGK